jgi:hypothetical protein
MGGLVALIVAVVASVSSASGDEIAGATYRGATANGATVELTVSQNGTKVDSYVIDGANGDPALGDKCTIHAEGHPPQFAGAAITNHSFSYQWYYATDIRGTFSGAQSVTGWFRLYNPAVEGVKPACDTGEVQFTLSTTATSPPPTETDTQPTETTPTVTGTSPPPPRAEVARYSSKLTLKRVGKKLRGKLTSKGPGCQVGRYVLLLSRGRAVARTKSGKDGSFTFRLSKSLAHKRVQAKIRAERSASAYCRAAATKLLTV